MRALIIDDEFDGVSVLHRMLTLNCKQVKVVGTCVNALEAKQQAEQLQPDLIFLDFQMPGKNGFELLSEMDARNFEVIFVTAHNQYMLQALQFHKTWLINLQHVNEYQRGEGGVVIMSNGAEVEISRRKKEQFLARIRGVFRC